MPCNSDYLDPTLRESYNQATAQHIVAIHTLTNLVPPLPILPHAKKDAKAPYGGADYTAPLCALLASPNVLADVQDAAAHSHEARAVLDWWEDHQKADKARSAKR